MILFGSDTNTRSKILDVNLVILIRFFIIWTSTAECLLPLIETATIGLSMLALYL